MLLPSIKKIDIPLNILYFTFISSQDIVELSEL